MRQQVGHHLLSYHHTLSNHSPTHSVNHLLIVPSHHSLSSLTSLIIPFDTQQLMEQAMVEATAEEAALREQEKIHYLSGR